MSDTESASSGITTSSEDISDDDDGEFGCYADTDDDSCSVNDAATLDENIGPNELQQERKRGSYSDNVDYMLSSDDDSEAPSTSTTKLPNNANRTKNSPDSNDDEQMDVDDSNLPKHLRHRYWTSWEELHLVELWRRHMREVTRLDKNIPIFRTIMEGMRECGFFVNSQECRRKISSIKNKYIAERRRLEKADTKEKSKWRLYSLVQSMFTSRENSIKYNHQTEIVEQVMRDALGLSSAKKTGSSMSSTSNVTVINKRVPLKAREQEIVPVCDTKSATQFSFIWSQQFTWTRVAQLRDENRRLAERRNFEIKRLIMEEKEYKYLKNFFKHWYQQQQQLLKKLEISS